LSQLVGNTVGFETYADYWNECAQTIQVLFPPSAKRMTAETI
jgi:hypothetical protein